MSTPLAEAIWTMDWFNKEIRPVIASVTSQGELKGTIGMRVLGGMDYITEILRYVEANADAIRAAARRQP